MHESIAGLGVPPQRNGRSGWKQTELRMQERTRWMVTVRDAFGNEQPFTIQASGGSVFGLLGAEQLKLTPEEVSELRKVLLDAQAEALRQGGGRF